MNTNSKRSNRYGSTSEMIIQINTAGMVGKIIVILIAILTILIVGCDMNAGYKQEEEPNDSPATATDMQQSEGSWAGKISTRDDIDYFALYFGAGQTYRFTLRDFQGDLNLMIYDESVSIGSNPQGADIPETVEITTSELGWYYVQVAVSGEVDASESFYSKYVVDQERID